MTHMWKIITCEVCSGEGNKAQRGASIATAKGTTLDKVMLNSEETKPVALAILVGHVLAIMIGHGWTQLHLAG